MGKSRQSSGGSGGNPDTDTQQQPTETPEEFQKRYDEAQKRLEDWKYLNRNGGISKALSKPQVKRVLDAVLNENTHFMGVMTSNGKHKMVFEERTFNSDGSENSQMLVFDLGAYKSMCKKNSTMSIEKLMETYRDIPQFRRNMVDEFNFGGTGKTFNGGFYHPGRNSVNINNVVFTSKNNQWPEHVFEHEMTHATDFNLASTHISQNSEVFRNIMKTNKASAYSEGYSWGVNSGLYHTESLAEAVASTRMARKYGSDVIMVEDPKDSSRQTMYSHAEWKKENPKLAEFAEKFIDCKNDGELKTLFGM